MTAYNLEAHAWKNYQDEFLRYMGEDTANDPPV